MADELSTTSYALLGLLALDTGDDTGVTGYELKQRCDATMRFYWISPATSKVYTELARLDRLGLLDAVDAPTGRRNARRYRLNRTGRARLVAWLTETEPDFPELRHPVALRLMVGNLVAPEQVEGWLTTYLARLEQRVAELKAVRDSIGDEPRLASPVVVADWGLAHFANETAIAEAVLDRVRGPVDGADPSIA